MMPPCARTAQRLFLSSGRGLVAPSDPTAKIPNMFRLMQIEEKISGALGIPVTITTRDALHPLMKDAIERDAIRVL